MPIHIAIDASRSTARQATGTEYYSLRLIQALCAANEGLDQPNRISLYLRDNPPAGRFPRFGERAPIRLSAAAPLDASALRGCALAVSAGYHLRASAYAAGAFSRSGDSDCS